MTQDEQKQFDHLQKRLTDADRSVEQVRAYFSSALDKTTCELRLYRGLFWSLLVLSLVATLVRIVQK